MAIWLPPVPSPQISARELFILRPVAASGSSDGDLQMLQWSTAGQGSQFAFFVHHTDAEHEGSHDRKSSIDRLDKGLDEARASSWTVVGMRQDWKANYPHEKK